MLHAAATVAAVIDLKTIWIDSFFYLFNVNILCTVSFENILSNMWITALKKNPKKKKSWKQNHLNGLNSIQYDVKPVAYRFQYVSILLGINLVFMVDATLFHRTISSLNFDIATMHCM